MIKQFFLRRLTLLAAAILFLTALLSGCGSIQTEGPSSGDTDSTASNVLPGEEINESMTLMVYMIGSDLETTASAASRDIEEMAGSGADLSRLNLLVCTGGSIAWHSDISSSKLTVFRLTEEGFLPVYTFPLASMGEPSSLTQFLSYGYENYPADRCGLILWDHGSGPLIGYGKDMLYGQDSLTLPEMKEALNASPFGPDNRLSFIGFDACLMASAELACTVSDYADYLVASQETEPSFGWNYDFLAGCGHMAVNELCRLIVENYIGYSEAYYAEKAYYRSDVTLSVTDLSHADELAAAIDALFAKAKNNVSGDYNRLARARVGTRALGRASTGSEYDLVDLASLMDTMQEDYPAETAAVKELLASMIVCTDSNTEGCCGLSFFYPYYNKYYYENSWEKSFLELGLFPEYRTFLSRFTGVWLGTTLKESFGEPLLASETEPGTYSLRLTDEQEDAYARSGYYILRRTGRDMYSVVFVSSDVKHEDGYLTAGFDGNVIYYKNDFGVKGIPVARQTDTENGTAYYSATVFLGNEIDYASNNPNRQGELQFSVDSETGEMTLIGLFSVPESGAEEDETLLQTGKREELDPYEWQFYEFYDIQSRYLVRGEDGLLKDFWAWPRNDLISWKRLPVMDGLHFTYEPLYDDGSEYYIVFRVYDTRNNGYSSELLPITLSKNPAETEPPAPPAKADWSEGTSAVLYDKNGVTISFSLPEDPDSGKVGHKFLIRNNNDFPVVLYLENISVNDTISLGTNNYLYSEVAAGAGESAELSSLDSLLSVLGTDVPGSLTLTVRLINGSHRGTMDPGSRIRLSLAETVTPQTVLINPFHEQAGYKHIADAEGLEIEMLGLSMTEQDIFSSGGAAKVRFRLTNHSEDTKRFYLHGVAMNGLMLEANQSVTIPAGCTGYLVSQLKDVAGQLAETGITSVSEEICHIGIAANNLRNDYTLKCILTDPGEGSPAEATGTLLYDCEYFSLYTDPVRVSENYDGDFSLRWPLWIRTKTDYIGINIRTEEVYLNGQETESGSYKNLIYVTPRSDCLTRFRTFSTWPDRDIPEISFVIAYSNASGTIAGRSERITLPNTAAGPEESEGVSPLFASDIPKTILQDEGLSAPADFSRTSLESTTAEALASAIFPLYDAEGTAIRLIASRDQSGAYSFRLSCRNAGNQSINIRIKDLIVNGNLLLLDSFSMYSSPGRCSCGRLSAADFALREIGPENIRTLSLTLSLSEDYGNPFYSETISFNRPEGIADALVYEDYCGALAHSQILEENENIRISLLGFGHFMDEMSRMTGFLCVENLSEETIPVRVSGMSIGGEFYSVSSDSFTLSAGMSCYPKFELIGPAVSAADCYTGDIALQILTASADNTGLHGLDGGRWYSVEVQNPSAAPRDSDRGQLLARAGDIEIRYLGKNDVSYLDAQYELLIVNNSGQDIELDHAEGYELPGGGMVGVIDSKVGAHTRRKAHIYLDKLEGAPVYAEIHLIITAQGGYSLLYELPETFILSEDGISVSKDTK